MHPVLDRLQRQAEAELRLLRAVDGEPETPGAEVGGLLGGELRPARGGAGAAVQDALGEGQGVNRHGGIPEWTCRAAKIRTKQERTRVLSDARTRRQAAIAR